MTPEDEEFARIEREAAIRATTKSQWVGLTDDEFEDIELGCRSTPFGKIIAMKKVAEKLKKKNT